VTLGTPEGAFGEDPAQSVDAKSRPAWVRPVVLVVILAVCVWVVQQFLGSIDWGAVWDALTRLAFWQVPVLLAFVVLRSLMNAIPLTLFIPGLSAWRALINDLTAAMMAIVAPPPADMMIRVGMFRSWGIDASWGLAGATMTTITFYINRFAAPLIGLGLFLTFHGEARRPGTVAVSVLIAGAILAVLTLVVRSERLAHRIGTAAGRLAQRLRPAVNPDEWAVATKEFRGNVAQRYRRGLPLSLVALTLMVLADAVVLLLALRFVGVSAAEVPTMDVIATFFLAYPLTLPPLMGLGILDVVLLGAFMEVGGDALEPEIIAALTVWRAMTILGPMVLGIGASAWWRRSISGNDTAAEPADDDSGEVDRP
jgi:hypothetical protein